MAVNSSKIVFEDFTGEVSKEIEDIVLRWLQEAGAELSSNAAQRTRRGTGETADKWTYQVDKSEYACYVGNPLENAIWEEFGTGEYALNDDGRKGGWVYRDDKTGKFHHTYGKTPNRALHHTFMQNEEPLKDLLRNRLGSMK